MSMFVDTGVSFAHHDADAVAAFDDLLDGEYGRPYTNDYVLWDATERRDSTT